MSCHLCLCSVPEPQFTLSLQTPASAHALLPAVHFLELPLEDNTFFSRFSVRVEVEREQKWEFGCECAGWILDKGAFGSVGWLLSGLHMKDFYSTPEKAWFSGQVLTCNRQYIHNTYCFWAANCFWESRNYSNNAGTYAKETLHSQKETIEMRLGSASECGHFALSKPMFMLKHS